MLNCIIIKHTQRLCQQFRLWFQRHIFHFLPRLSKDLIMNLRPSGSSFVENLKMALALSCSSIIYICGIVTDRLVLSFLFLYRCSLHEYKTNCYDRNTSLLTTADRWVPGAQSERVSQSTLRPSCSCTNSFLLFLGPRSPWTSYLQWSKIWL